MIKYRDLLHCDIVQEAGHKNFMKTDNSDGVLQLHRPFDFRMEYYRPYENEHPIEDMIITGIDCTGGWLVGETKNGGEERNIRYTDLTQEDLIDLHKYVVIEKNYTFTPYKQLV
jgi:hypothetical protein